MRIQRVSAHVFSSALNKKTNRSQINFSEPRRRRGRRERRRRRRCRHGPRRSRRRWRAHRDRGPDRPCGAGAAAAAGPRGPGPGPQPREDHDEVPHEIREGPRPRDEGPADQVRERVFFLFSFPFFPPSLENLAPLAAAPHSLSSLYFFWLPIILT